MIGKKIGDVRRQKIRSGEGDDPIQQRKYFFYKAAKKSGEHKNYCEGKKYQIENVEASGHK